MGGMLRTNLVRLYAVTALVATGACGDGGAKPAPIDGLDEMDGGGIGTGMRDASRRDSSVDAGPVLGPLIEVVSPEETDDPASSAVVSGSSLTVRCSIKKNPKGEDVNPKSAKVAIYANDEAQPVLSQVAASTSDEEVFQAENISLAEVPHGTIRVECSASDLATKVQTSATSIYTLYDQGPKITFLEPMDKGFVSVGKGDKGTDVVVRFKVEPRPLSDDDDGAELAEVKASVGGKPVPAIEPSTSEENVYSFPLDFNDTEFFSAVPKTLSVRIDATNSRKPTARSSVANLAVGVDSEGPTITVRSPVRVGGLDPVVSGKVDLVMDVKDALAGVNASTVQIQIQKNGTGAGAPGSDFYQAQALGDGVFTVSFETGTYSGRPRITITLLAKDNVGIATESSLTVDVDTVPPWISLDPPTVRELTLKAPMNECSGPFDPLGDAVNEGVVIGDTYRVRALIWDRPLTATNQTSSRYAMIDNTSAKLYIQHSTNVPLLIDSDGDANHECDKINTSVENTALAPTAIMLAPVRTAGTAPASGTWVQVTPSTFQFQVDMTADPSVVGMCTSTPATLEGPKPISSDTTMTRVIKHRVPGNNDVVYADSPAVSGSRVTGSDYNPPPGWACLVATAKDNAGNFGFSPPMRVCAERLGVTCEATPPPSITCTDGCVIPAKFLPGATGAMPRVIDYPP
jgi:hypothetical protein